VLGNYKIHAIDTPDPSKFFIPDEQSKFLITLDKKTVIANTPVGFHFYKNAKNSEDHNNYPNFDKFASISIDGNDQKYPNYEIN
jgi:hypothetical protein